MRYLQTTLSTVLFVQPSSIAHRPTVKSQIALVDLLVYAGDRGIYLLLLSHQHWLGSL